MAGGRSEAGRRRWGWNAAAHRMGIPFEEYERHRLAGDSWCSRCRQWKPMKTGFYLSSKSGTVVARKPCKACRERERDAWRERQAGRLK